MPTRCCVTGGSGHRPNVRKPCSRHDAAGCSTSSKLGVACSASGDGSHTQTVPWMSFLRRQQNCRRARDCPETAKSHGPWCASTLQQMTGRMTQDVHIATAGAGAVVQNCTPWSGSHMCRTSWAPPAEYCPQQCGSPCAGIRPLVSKVMTVTGCFNVIVTGALQ